MNGLSEILDLSAEKALSATAQDPFRFRTLRRARLLAAYLMTDTGELESARLTFLLSLWKEQGYIYYPSGTIRWSLYKPCTARLTETPRRSPFSSGTQANR